MIYAFLGLILFAIIGTGAGYYKGRGDGEDIYKAKAEAAQVKVDAQARQLIDESVQHQADVVAAFDKGKAQNEQKAQIIYVKGTQVVAADNGIRNPICVMAADSMGLLNAARAGADVGASYELKPPAVVTPPATVPRSSAPLPVAAQPTHPKPRPISDLDLRLLGLNQ